MAANFVYYEVLGLEEPPADRKAVKRAYSKMLKETRPEDDPEGFMRLRDAHDLALNIIARQAENAAWQAEQAQIESHPENEAISSPDALTYEDMIPNDPKGSDTSYSIGSTQSLNAPPPEKNEASSDADTSYAIGPTPALNAPLPFSQPKAPKTPPLLDFLDALLQSPNQYNDRERWNQLFRKARQLDIDDYVDFEHLLLDHILHFHGFYQSDNSLYETPEKMEQKLSPSIAASLFKTMSWDQVNTQGYHRGHQIEWLERRMNIRRFQSNSVPIPETKSGGNGKIWLILFGVFLLSRILLAVTDS